MADFDLHTPYFDSKQREKEDYRRLYAMELKQQVAEKAEEELGFANGPATKKAAKAAERVAQTFRSVRDFDAMTTTIDQAREALRTNVREQERRTIARACEPWRGVPRGSRYPGRRAFRHTNRYR